MHSRTVGPHSTLVPYPAHAKSFNEGDFFRYFEKRHYDVEEVAKFDFQENLYTQLIWINFTTKDTIIRQRYSELLNHSTVPMVYSSYIYFSHDP